MSDSNRRKEDELISRLTELQFGGEEDADNAHDNHYLSQSLATGIPPPSFNFKESPPAFIDEAPRKEESSSVSDNFTRDHGYWWNTMSQEQQMRPWDDADERKFVLLTQRNSGWLKVDTDNWRLVKHFICGSVTSNSVTIFYCVISNSLRRGYTSYI